MSCSPATTKSLNAGNVVIAGICSIAILTSPRTWRISLPSRTSSIAWLSRSDHKSRAGRTARTGRTESTRIAWRLLSPSWPTLPAAPEGDHDFARLRAAGRDRARRDGRRLPGPAAEPEPPGRPQGDPRTAPSATEDDVRRFRNEAEAVANLDHPAHRADLRGRRASTAASFFSMKLIEGASLAERLPEYQRPTPRRRPADGDRRRARSTTPTSEASCTAT